eukprot:261891-Pyramimonas_sp.AAC.1
MICICGLLCKHLLAVTRQAGEPLPPRDPSPEFASTVLQKSAAYLEEHGICVTAKYQPFSTSNNKQALDGEEQAEAATEYNPTTTTSSSTES